MPHAACFRTAARPALSDEPDGCKGLTVNNCPNCETLPFGVTDLDSR